MAKVYYFDTNAHPLRAVASAGWGCAFFDQECAEKSLSSAATKKPPDYTIDGGRECNQGELSLDKNAGAKTAS